MSNRLRTSEYVSLGHPDKVADYISEYILDHLLAADPHTRYALECQIKDEFVCLAGEVTTKANNWKQYLLTWCREAVNSIGYTEEYQKKFGGDKYTICGKQIAIAIPNISFQSPDIATGVNKQGWGDQGIFFGTWNSESKDGYTMDYAMAKKIGKYLYDNVGKDPAQPYGIDIKTQVTYDEIEKEIVKVVVAIPTVEGKITHKEVQTQIRNIIKKQFPETKKAQFVINGTGEYHIHGPVGDSGTTGRKLVVDFYGSGSRIGGGSPWTKDGTKADLTLNMFAREIARLAFFHWKEEMPNIARVDTELSCCIGKQEVLCITTAYDEDGIPLNRTADERKVPTDFLINRYALKTPKFARLCEEGLFSDGLEG